MIKRFVDFVKRNVVAIGSFMGVSSAVAAHATYTAPTDLPSLFAIVDISTFSTQVLLMYGLGAGLLLIGIGWYVLKSGGKKAVRGTL